MRYIGWFWKIYLSVLIILVLFLFARLLFGQQRAELLRLLPVAAIWPLALLHRQGRRALAKIISGTASP